MHGKYIFDNLDWPINWLLGEITLSLGGNGCCLHENNEEVNRFRAQWQNADSVTTDKVTKMHFV